MINKKGFTLLEILLVVAAIGILAAIVLLAINPNRQLAQFRDSVRQRDINTIQKAIDQYLIDSNGVYPSEIPIGNYKEICLENGENSLDCIDLVPFLVPTYIAKIPQDPTGGKYLVAISPRNNKISVIAGNSENSQIAINKFIPTGFQDLEFNSFAPLGFNSTVNTMAVQDSDKTLIGGAFTTYQGGIANRLIKLNSDGSRDANFAIGSGFNNIVNTIVVQNDNKILVGGTFTSYQGVSSNKIVRINADGNRDSSFNIGSAFGTSNSVTVTAIAVQSDGKILVGGTFTSYQGVSVNRIVRLNENGSRDTNFAIETGFENTVNTIAVQSDGKILIGGSFTTYQGVSANRIVRLNDNGSRDMTLDIGTGFNNIVNTITVQEDNRILMGGTFTSYQGVSANRIIRLNNDGSRDTNFNIGGGFNSTVLAIVLQSGGKILVGGAFSTYPGVTSNRLISLNNNGSIDTSFNVGTGFDSTINTIVLNNDKILVGGLFITYQEIGVGRILSLNTDASIDEVFNSGNGFNSTINTIATQGDNKILVGGLFTSYQGGLANRISRLNIDGSVDAEFNVSTGFNSNVQSIVVQGDDSILVGGLFTTYQGVSANRLIKLNNDGSRDLDFNIGGGFNNIVNTIAVQSDGKILIGGSFTTYQGVAVNRIIRLNDNGSIDTTFDIGGGFNNIVNTIAVQSDGKILIGGSFTTYQGVSVNRIIRLNDNGSIDTTFDIGGGFNNIVNTIAVQGDNQILIGGTFTAYQGVTVNRIIRLNDNGDRDANFNIGAGFNSTVLAVAIQNDGKILLGGAFTSYQGVVAARAIRLNTDGTRDTSFDIGTGFDGTINSILLRSSGNILMGGLFTNYKNQISGYLIRIGS
jgi:uncharacterized delta-60 repeat protein/prepilin-type N-terminal cleavage/methylation domain-containing protein